MSKIKKYYYLPLFSALISGCGGGSDGGDDSSSSTPPVDEINAGGPPSNPSPVSFSAKNKITPNEIENYFTFEAKKDEELIIHSTLDFAISDTRISQCMAAPGESYTGMIISGLTYTCHYYLKKEIPQNGTFTLYSEYPDGNQGYFEARVFNINNKEYLGYDGKGGFPDKPHLISHGQQHEINVNTLSNYYYIDMKAGQTLTMQAYLDGNIDEQVPSRCVTYPHYSNPDSFGFSQAWRKGSYTSSYYNCSTKAKVTFSSDGVYEMHVRMPYQIGGYFVVDIHD